MDQEKIIELAIKAGFQDPESNVGLSGTSEKDELIYCDEYPVGESILEFARLLLEEKRND